MRISLLALLGVLVLAGCPTRDQLQSDGGAPAASTIAITSPVSTIYTNSSVTIAVTTNLQPTTPISILAGTAAVGTLTTPGNSFQWDTTFVPEGTYAVTAQATVGSAIITSAPVTIIVDRTPPAIATLDPPPGTADVVLAAPLSIVFSEPVLGSSVTSALASVEAGSTTVPTNLVLSADGRTVTITITSHDGLILPQTFTASLGAGGVTDLAGNHLTVPATPWTWTVPDWIRLAPIGSNTAPLLAVGPDFHPAIIYTQCNLTPAGCALPLHVAVNDGQGWNDLGSPLPGASGKGASIAIDGQGHAVVAWADFDGTIPDVRVATWNGSSWDPPLPPLDAVAIVGGIVASVILRIDSTGKPVVAFQETSPSSSDIFVARWNGSAWDNSPGAVGVPGVGSFDLVLDEKDDPVVGFISAAVNGFALWDGTAWTLSPNVAASTPNVGYDSAGAPLMIEPNWHIEHLTNGTWIPTVPIAVPTSATSRDARLATTPDHQPVVAWLDPSLSPAKLGLARWTGSLWNVGAGLVNGTDSPNDQPPALVVDGRGSIWLSWSENLQAYIWMSNY